MMKLRDLVKSFDMRADSTAKGEFYLTAKQYAFALALAEKERVSLECIEQEIGVRFRTWAIGSNARFYGTKYARLQSEAALAEMARGHARNSISV